MSAYYHPVLRMDGTEVELGASPRAMLGLSRAAQALAAIRGRIFVMPDDIKYLAPFVLEHRIIPRAQTHLRGQTAGDIIAEVVAQVPSSLPISSSWGTLPMWVSKEADERRRTR